MKRASFITSRIWNLTPPRTIDFLLNRLFEQARQSNSEGGSPTQLLILNSIQDLGGVDNVKVSWPGDQEAIRLKRPGL